MVYASVPCPTCHRPDVVKHGKTTDEQQRFLCQNPTGSRHTLLTAYVYKGRWPAIQAQIIDMAMNGRGLRDTARVLPISPTTVIDP
jgi:transposase-like protein